MMDQERKTRNIEPLVSYLPKSCYRVDEVAAYFSISVRTVYRLLNKGNLQGTCIRKCLRVSSAEISRFGKNLTEE